MIKMVALDLDGTLLNKEGKITDYTKQTLQTVQNKGVKIVVCTGRMYKDAYLHARLSDDTKVTVIACNGAVVKTEDDTFIADKTIDVNTAYDILKQLQKTGIYYHAYDKDTIYADRLVHSALMYENRNKKYGKDWYIHVVIDENLADRVLHNQIRLNKIMFIEQNKELLDEAIEIVRKFDTIELTASSDSCTEMMVKGTTKGSGLKMICDYYKISPSDVMAFGDSYNDISMMEFAGYPVAMGNACEKIKKLSKEITLSNNEDGVAYGLRRLLE